ncbi:hypothetical protein P7C73_g3699, partial [Tremellales sp. Uapishka_1]
MPSSSPLFSLALVASCLILFPSVQAATADQWRGKSIYQLITDRFAPPSSTAPARTSPIPQVCDPALQTWCGGTWLSIIDKLDYIQGMGFDAIWISPISQNLDVYTPYNYAYHGYWVTDPLTLNPRFGSSDDLHALSAAVHARGMLLMVDIVINNVPSLSVNTSTSTAALVADGSRWTDPAEFHEFCWIDYENQTSVEYCWLGDNNLPLMDVNTENPTVISTLNTWIGNLTETYAIDGLRVDAAKHVPGAFWQSFCNASKVFCIGEVYGSDIGFASQFQTQKWMDSILGYPLYYGLVNAFGTPNGNMSSFVDIAHQVLTAFPDAGLLGNFLENHDLPRWRNTTADPQLEYNAMVAQFFFDGLPLVYYGQEQDFYSGAADPYNRAALWPSNYTNTTTYQRIGKFNSIRHTLINNGSQVTFNGTNFLQSTSQIIATTANDVAIRKGPLIIAMTNRGSPSQNASFGIPKSGFPSLSGVIDLLTCRQYAVGSDESLSISYGAPGSGGEPYIFISQTDAAKMGLCGSLGVSVYTAPKLSAAKHRLQVETSAAVILMAIVATLSKNPDDPSAHVTFQKIGKAYETLSDPDSRAAYDEYGPDGPQRAGGGGGFSSFEEDLFEQMFGGFGMGGGGASFSFDPSSSSGRTKPSRGNNTEVVYEINLEDAFKGKRVVMNLERDRLCSHCEGSGGRKGAKLKDCSKCEGKGKITADRHLGPGLVGKFKMECPECEGEGKKIREKDRKCQGKKVRKEKKRVEFQIEPGTEDGERIALKGEADEAPGIPPGDVIFRIKFRPHPHFTARPYSSDLSITVPISLSEALLGLSRVLFVHLDGRGIRVESKRSERIIESGQEWLIKNEGMPKRGKGSRGDLIVTFKVEHPNESWAGRQDPSSNKVELPGPLEELSPLPEVIDVRYLTRR